MRDILYTFFGILTAMIGYTIHGSLFYSIIIFFIWPIAIIYWFCTHDLTLGVVKQTFEFFFR